MSPTSVVDMPILPAAWLFIFFMVAIMAASTAWADFRLAQGIEHHHGRADGRHGVDHVLAGILGRAAAHGLEHGNALRVDVAARGNAQSALDHGAQVGDDIAEEVLRDRDIEPFGVLHEPHVRRIDVVIVALELGILLRAHFLESAVPEIAAMGQHVPLVDQRDGLIRVLLVRLRCASS